MCVPMVFHDYSLRHEMPHSCALLSAPAEFFQRHFFFFSNLPYCCHWKGSRAFPSANPNSGCALALTLVTMGSRLPFLPRVETLGT
jgi:hypothetical protein